MATARSQRELEQHANCDHHNVANLISPKLAFPKLPYFLKRERRHDRQELERVAGNRLGLPLRRPQLDASSLGKLPPKPPPSPSSRGSAEPRKSLRLSLNGLSLKSSRASRSVKHQHQSLIGLRRRKLPSPRAAHSQNQYDRLLALACNAQNPMNVLLKSADSLSRRIASDPTADRRHGCRPLLEPPPRLTAR